MSALARIFGYLERTLSAPAKLLVALGVMISFGTATVSALAVLDARYVHYAAYAGDMSNISERMDRTDLRGLEGQIRTVNAQIFDLERLKTLTFSELAFLKQLRADRDRLEADIRELRASIQEQQRKASVGRGR